MKRYPMAVILLLSNFILLSCCNTGGTAAPVEDAANGNSTIRDIHARASIRHFTDQKLTEEQLETLVKAGMAAPSATNAQPWHFIILDDPALLAAIGDRIATSKPAREAPAAILVCGDLHKAKEGWLQQYWIQDCSAASQNILLAATSMHLGAVWTSIYPAPERIRIVAELLDLPEHIIPLNVIPVGHPRTDKEPMVKWNPGNVSRNKWR